MSEFCLTLLCLPAIEEKLLDVLLMSDVKVFTSTPTAEHGLDQRNLDPMEQVLGRARATQVQAIIATADKEPLLEALRRQFSGTGLRYWVTPVIEAGEIE